MFKISVDEAVAYDMLTILLLKQRSQPTEAGQQAYDRLAQELCEASGDTKHAAILGSAEYQQLIDINHGVFSMLIRVNREGEWPNDALDIDRLNYQRHPVKRALQERFFPDSPLTERKTY